MVFHILRQPKRSELGMINWVIPFCLVPAEAAAEENLFIVNSPAEPQSQLQLAGETTTRLSPTTPTSFVTEDPVEQGKTV